MNISLKLNTVANYIGLLYVSLLGIFVMPLYLQYLKPEAFGLVGFFILIQAFMPLADLGMSHVMLRQTSKARAEGDDFVGLYKLLRSFEVLLLVISISGVLAVYLASEWLAIKWFNVESLKPETVMHCLTLMSLIFSVRLFTLLYRSEIQGMERQVWLNSMSVIISTVKFIGALLLLVYVTNSIVHFFEYQLTVAIAEFLVFYSRGHRFFKEIKNISFKFYRHEVKKILPLASAISYSVIVWVLLTQMDKLILSKILTLTQFGYFSLAVIISTGIRQFIEPISQAILPRLTYLVSKQEPDAMIALYRKATQFMLIILLPLTMVIAVFAKELLYVLTGNTEIPDWVPEVLKWIALGNGILAITTFQYFLQYAYGQLKLHTIYTSISVVIQVPVVIFAALEYGALGVAIVWFILQLITFLFWVPVIHYKFLPGLHFTWLSKDFFPVFVVTLVYILLIKKVDINFYDMSRIAIFSFLFAIGVINIVFNTLVSSEGRKLIQGIIKKIASRA